MLRILWYNNRHATPLIVTHSLIYRKKMNKLFNGSIKCIYKLSVTSENWTINQSFYLYLSNIGQQLLSLIKRFLHNAFHIIIQPGKVTKVVFCVK